MSLVLGGYFLEELILIVVLVIFVIVAVPLMRSRTQTVVISLLNTAPDRRHCINQ